MDTRPQRQYKLDLLLNAEDCLISLHFNVFSENEIEIPQFKDLDDELLKELCPAIGMRLKLNKKFKNLHFTGKFLFLYEWLYLCSIYLGLLDL